MQRRKLIDGRRRPVIIDLDVIEEADGSASSTDVRHFVLQIAQHFLHASLGCGLDVLDRLELCCCGGTLRFVFHRCRKRFLQDPSFPPFVRVSQQNGKRSRRTRASSVTEIQQINVPTGSPIAAFMMLPYVLRLKTRIGSLLSRHIATAEASITPSAFAKTSR